MALWSEIPGIYYITLSFVFNMYILGCLAHGFYMRHSQKKHIVAKLLVLTK